MRGRRRERKHPEASDQNRGTRTASLERERRKLYGHQERGASLQVGWGWWFSRQVMSGSCDSMDCSLPGSFVHGDSLGKNTGVGCHFLLPGIFSTQE